MFKGFTILVIMLAAILGPAIVISIVGSNSAKALARNPAVAPKILTTMILSFLFIEAIAIIALIVTVYLIG